MSASTAAARANKRARAQQASLKAFVGGAPVRPLSRGEWLRARWDLVFIVQRRNLLMQHPDAAGHAIEIASLETEHDKLIDKLGAVVGVSVGDTVPTKWVI